MSAGEAAADPNSINPTGAGVSNRSIAALTASRFAGNVAYRLAFPFLPAIARGLGISLVDAGVVLSVRDLAGFLAPVGGRLADRLDRRHLMAGAAVLGGFALALATASTSMWVLAATLFFANTVKLAHDIAMGAWISDRVAFDQRSRVIGINETSWGLAQLLGIPAIGLIIDRWGWQAGFWAAALLTMAGSALLAGAVPEDPRGSTPTRRTGRLPRHAWGLLLGLSALGFGMQIVFVTFGAWFEDDFGLSVAAIGASALLLGGAELVGTAMTIRFTDRIGKRRSVLVGLVPMAVVVLTAGHLVEASWAAVVAIAALVLFFEFTIVSSIPLLTELNAAARGNGLGLSIAFQTVARAAGGVLGTMLYESGGMARIAQVTAASIAVTWLAFAFVVAEPDQTDAESAPGEAPSLGQ